jgi:hypothetical protein
MTITKILTPVAFVALLALTAAPAHAGQRRGESGRSSGRSRGAAVSRGGGDRGGGVTASRGGAQTRSYSGYRGGGYYRGGPAFYRPYYSFRPRVSLGFGLWMGYPVTYPYYDNPYGYANPYPADPYAYGSAAPSYGYPAQAPNYPPSAYPGYGSSGQGYPSQQSRPSVGVQRGGGQSSRGGISFEITPDTAEVFVDGTYVGTAGEFGPAAQPLDLPGGRRHVEIRASGYRTMTFDADVQSGQVIPYQGTLQRN